MTVFDFAAILERTERRVEIDLLGAGPKTVDELRSIAGRLKLKYQNQLERKIQRHLQQQERTSATPASSSGGIAASLTSPNKVTEVFSQAGSMAGGLFAKIKTAPGFPIPSLPRKEDPSKPMAAATATTPMAPEPAPTIVALPPLEEKPAPTSTLADEGDWVGTDIKSATDAISNFSIGDEDDEDML